MKGGDERWVGGKEEEEEEKRIQSGQSGLATEREREREEEVRLKKREQGRKEAKMRR